MQWIAFHGLPDFETGPPQRGGSNTRPGDHDTSLSHSPWTIITLLCRRAHVNRKVMMVESLVAYVFTLH
jgi:hypothetical protein